MKIAILTAFRVMPDHYSLVNDVRDQIKTLVKNGHDIVFFAQEGCKGTGIACPMKAIFPHYRIEKGVVNEEVSKEIKAILEKELRNFEVAITHDLIYLQHYVTYRRAIMTCDVPNIKWIHWAHSGMSGIKIKMPRSKYIYMNYIDAKRFADAIGVELNDVRVVFNDKDPRIFFDWHPITQMIADKYDLLNRDIIQTYPMCSTRMSAKGIDLVIRVFGKLKQLGNKVLLVIPNSNSNRKTAEVQAKIEFARSKGLSEDECVFTSTISSELTGGVPHQVVRDLMQISNLFVFPSVSEVCSNVLLEASMTKQLVVLNKDFPAFFDFGEENKTCLAFHFGSLLMPGYKYRGDEALLTLAKIINQQLLSNKSNLQFQKILKTCNIDAIYKKQLEPILYENY